MCYPLPRVTVDGTKSTTCARRAGDVIASEPRTKDLMVPEAGKRLALFGGAAWVALAALCVGGGAGAATTTAAPPTSGQPAPPPTEPTEIYEEPHDLGGGAGGGMG